MLLSKAEGKYPITGSTRSQHDLHQKALGEEKKEYKHETEENNSNNNKRGKNNVELHNLQYSLLFQTCYYLCLLLPLLLPHSILSMIMFAKDVVSVIFSFTLF